MENRFANIVFHFAYSYFVEVFHVPMHIHFVAYEIKSTQIEDQWAIRSIKIRKP